MTTCRSCGAEIIWTISAATGKRMPLDAEPREDGNVAIEGGRAYVGPIVSLVLGPRYVSHFSTCPEAGEWRR